MQSIHIRPPEIKDCLVPGQGKGDVIQGSDKRSSADTLVDRTTGFVALAATTRPSSTASPPFSPANQR
ncbi:hypothetical protein [Janthinobacterium lividum]|uniref:hypothetical protein n=1 Tax=Janthinobacterium lividum TaxID=29581 RepID=UPI000FE1E1DF|nr:hypothetical protein [Janthinobacterium lividum]